MVTHAITQAPLVGARVTVDGQWQQTGPDGTVSTELEPGTFSYRVEAPGFHFVPEPFTATPTVAVPANLTTTTTVALWPSLARSGPGSIAGQVTQDGAPVAGALVVATSAIEGFAYTDGEGRYLITQLNAGEYRVRAFMGGRIGTEKTRVAVSEATDGVDLVMAGTPAGSVGGAVSGGSTRVWLTHPTTGEPIPGLVAEVTGGRYILNGVAAGSYGVRAGLERDGLTLDPDPIHEYGPIEVTVADAAVTRDLTLLPAVLGLSPTDTTSAPASPSFDWTPVPNADFYVLEVFDLDGVSLSGGFDAVGSPRTRILQKPVAYTGPALAPGGRYRWRVWAGENDAVVASEFKLIAASEERGGEIIIRR